MAAQHFLALVAGRITRVFALLSSAGAGSANAIPALDATGKLDPTFMPAGFGSNTLAVVASEALAAGAVVNLWSSSGTLKVRNADNTAPGKEVDGYVVAAVLSGATATVYLGDGGLITGLSGLTIGDYYVLGTAGAIVDISAAPTTAGNVLQQVGRAESASVLVFEREPPITL